MDEKRTPDGRFGPGASGNPNGRKKGVERVWREETAKLAGQPDDDFAGLRKMIGVLYGIATNPGSEDKDRTAAAKIVVEHVGGKPKEHVELDSPDSAGLALAIAAGLTPHERRQKLAALDAAESDGADER